MNLAHSLDHGVETPPTTHCLLCGIAFSRTKETLLTLPAAASVQRVLAELRAYEIL